MIIAEQGSSIDFIHPSRQPSGEFVDVILYNKGNRKTTTVNGVSAVYGVGLLQFSLAMVLKDNESYYMTVIDAANGRLLFNSNVFITNQTDLQDFSVIDGDVITPPQQSNEFLKF